MPKINKDKYEAIMYRTVDLTTQLYAIYFYQGFDQENNINGISHQTLKELNEDMQKIYEFLRIHLSGNVNLGKNRGIFVVKK